MSTRAHLVRLLGAVAASTLSCWFVVVYSRLSFLRFHHEHPGGQLIRATEFLSHTAWVGYGLPVAASLLGLWVLRRSGDCSVRIEIVLAGTWLLSLAWLGGCLLFWQAQNVPTFSHMEFHF